MRSKYYAAAITAFAIWGMFSFVLRPLHDYPSQDILFYRIFTCVALMLPLNLLFRRRQLKDTLQYFKAMEKAEQKNILWLTLISSLMLVANWFTFIFVMNHISVKAASLAYMLCPILTTVLAFFILREKLVKMQWGAVLISVAGCALLSIGSYSDLFYSLLVAGSYALYLVLQKKFTGFDRFVLLSTQITLTGIMLLPFYFVYSGTVPQEPKFYGYISLIAVGFTIFPMFLNLFALKGIKSSTLGILMYLNPLIGFGLSAFYYNEAITPIQLVSYALIVVSIIVFNVGNYSGNKN
ncbi:EamA family transporter [Flavobacterium sp. RHBU_3]|uniref:EamA family transporter n=1 Tax=Flavobacterium sp. RHBU_3 TaxID=3391184 RepID=UPI0039853F2B